MFDVIRKIRLKDKAYNALKWIALLGLPVMSWLYTEVAPVWGLPYAAEISLTCARVGTAIGALIGVSSFNYHTDRAGDGNAPEQ